MSEPLELTAFTLAQRFVGLREIAGDDDHPFIRWSHSLTTFGEASDEVPWCSSWLNAICWLLRLPRSKSAAARSWLEVGQTIDLDRAQVGFDIVVLRRGASATAGHVGLFAGLSEDHQTVQLLAGNHGDAVTVAGFPVRDVLGIRRLR